MTTQEIQKLHSKITNSIDKRELKNVFDSLYQVIDQSMNYMFREKVSEIKQTYKQMLHYFAQGSNDSLRLKIYNDIIVSLYELNDHLAIALNLVNSNQLYFSTKRTIEMRKESFPVLLDNISNDYDLGNYFNAESSVIRLFKYIWTSSFLSDDDFMLLQKRLQSYSGKIDSPESKNKPANKKSLDISSQQKTGDNTILNCQIVAALTLGLISFFDKKKLLLLFDAALSDDEEIRQRAYIGIMLTLFIYRSRITFYPEVVYPLEALLEIPGFKKAAYFIVLRFILSRETEKISKKLKDEIIPEMIRLNPRFRPRSSWKDFTPEQIDEEMNPEWLEKFADSPLGQKIEELNKLQEEGIDVMHSTFIHLKSFPFFYEISNWFLPFIKDKTSIANDCELVDSLEIITNVGLMCNSDLYSLYFSIKQIPETSRNLMIGQLEGQLGELKNQKLASLQTRDNQTEKIIGCYIQDLYRFFKLFSRRNEFTDIFSLPLDFHNITFLKSLFSDTDELMNIADLYLRKNYFEDALNIFGNISVLPANKEILFQKTGYCKQMTGNFTEAISEYAKAEIINPDNKWLIRKMAQCYKATKNTDKALSYYLNYEKIDPDNLSILLNIGSCFLELRNYTAALKYYFKVDYLDSKGNKAWKPIAWCSFLTGKYDQAHNYYNKILSGKPELQDYINAGHTEWVLQNISRALFLYQEAVLKANGVFKTFLDEFEKDIPELINAGIDRNEIHLVLDQLRFTT
jgi:tetratricopeptide (TPR) repeat protein